MSDKISTKAGIFESGEKDVFGVQYKDGRLIACRNNQLTDYTVADGTEVICDRAFMNLRDLRSLVLPSTIQAIGESAFSGCKSLLDVNIPEGVNEIRQATFRDTDALTALELPASVTEVEKFAFGRNLETLVVSSPDVKFDRYAFANVKDLKTLIVPAGSADYYRSQLFDIRVKADVEEMEPEPSSLLDAFIDEPEKMTEEINQILKTNDMEEAKKMKTVTVEVFGYEKFLEPKDADDNEVYDAYSRFAMNKMVFTVDGNEYHPIDLEIDYDVLEDYQDLNVAVFFEESGAEEGFLYTNKAWTTIEIEMPEDEEFDRKKATIVTRRFIYPDDERERVVNAFAYDGKIYPCDPGNSTGVSSEKIWPYDPDAKNDDDDDWGSWDEEEPEEEEEEAVLKYGFVDKTGVVVIEPKFDSVSDFCDGIAKVRVDDKYGYIDKTGEYIVEPTFDDAEDFHEGIAQVELDDKYGYIDKTGAYIVEPKFDYGYPYNEGVALVKLDGMYGFINKSGAYIAEPKFDDAEKFCEGAARVEVDGLYGFINTEGAYIVEPKFDAIKDFCDGLAKVKLDGKWGCIDKSGAYVVEPQFEYVGDFSDGLAIVKG